MKHIRFSIASLLVLTAIVAAFFAGRQSMVVEGTTLRLENEELRVEAKELRRNAVDLRSEFKFETAMLKWEWQAEAARLIKWKLMSPASPDISGKGLSMGKLKIRVVAWNVNFAGRSRAVIAKQLVGLGRYHIYGLTKISPGDTAFYLKNIQSLGNGYNSIVRATGGDDRMMVYDSFRLEVLEKTELKANGGVRTNDVNFPDRSPLMVRFKDKANDIEFTVVLSDFAGGSADLRWEQARALRLWATGQTVPIIALGDYSFDYDFSARRSDDAAFFELVAGKTWFWVKPRFDQIWSDRNGDGVYDNPASCDFTFVNVEARSWSPRSRVLVGSPDDVRTSDHLPVELVVRPR